MKDNTEFNQSIANEQHRDGNSSRCDVTEMRFPCMGKCCQEIRTLMGVSYEKSCPRCHIWTSLPDGVSLSVTYIFECSLNGYDKRMKQ